MIAAGLFTAYKLGYFKKVTSSVPIKTNVKANNSNDNLNKPEDVKPVHTNTNAASQNYDTTEPTLKTLELNLYKFNLTLTLIIKKLLDDQDFSNELTTLSNLALEKNILTKLNELKVYNDKYLSSKILENDIIFPYGWGKKFIENLIVIEYNPRGSSKFKKLKHHALNLLLEMQDEVLQVNLLQSK